MALGRHFAIFSFLFAAAVLFHQARLSDGAVLSEHAVLTLSALLLLLRPRSAAAFLLLAAAIVVDWAIHMPVVVNHVWAIAVLAATTLVAAAVALVRGRRWPLDGGELYARFSPALRTVVVLVYLVAAVAKMNDGFLDPAVSCGVAMSDELLGWLPFDLTASWQHAPAIWGTIAVELIIPVLLVFKRTRLLALAIGIPFHVILALSGHTPFSGFAMAFYSLFLPVDFPDRLARIGQRIPQLGAAAARIGAAAGSRLAFPLLALGWLACALLVEGDVRTTFDRGVTLAFAAYAATITSIAALALHDGHARPLDLLAGRGVRARDNAFRLAHPAWAVVPVLAVANAASPYVGLKTQVSFTMYSNLQTEGDQWNHAVVPKGVRVFELQDDLVQVVSSSDRRLSAAAESGTRLVWHDFRRHARRNPEAAVTYERGGRRFTLARASDDPRLVRRESLIERKLLQFRDVPIADRNDCRSLRSAGADQGS